MVPWPSELKLCREMGTHPERVTAYVWTWYHYPRGTKNGAPGSMKPKPCDVCPSLDVAVGLDFAVGCSFVAGWDFI